MVEDDAHSLMAISALLKELGILYKRNTTGSDVVEKALSMRPKPDFILLDLNLPHGDAFQILRAFKAHPLLARVPVIAIADERYHDLISKTRAAGFAGFIAKPLPRRMFGELLQRILGGEQVWQVLA